MFAWYNFPISIFTALNRPFAKASRVYRTNNHLFEDNGLTSYRVVPMYHVSFLTFLKSHVRVKHIIDYLFMDNKGAEIFALKSFSYF